MVLLDPPIRLERGGEAKLFKKILIVFSALIFAFSVLSISIFNASTETLAALRPPLKIIVSPSPTTVPTPKPEVQYYLPYPGILPDHPLYPLKMVRDRIWLWLTTDVLRKTEVLLLFSDKRLGAARALVEGNKVDLGITTLEKAEKYLERAVIQFQGAKKKGKDVSKISEKLQIASQKHYEVIEKISESLTGEAKTVAESLLRYPKEVLRRIEGLSE